MPKSAGDGTVVPAFRPSRISKRNAKPWQNRVPSKNSTLKRKEKAKAARQRPRLSISPEFARLRKDNCRVTN
jgi:hypothetical protein